MTDKEKIIILREQLRMVLQALEPAGKQDGDEFFHGAEVFLKTSRVEEIRKALLETSIH